MPCEIYHSDKSVGGGRGGQRAMKNNEKFKPRRPPQKRLSPLQPLWAGSSYQHEKDLIAKAAHEPPSANSHSISSRPCSDVSYTQMPPFVTNELD